MAAFPSPAPKTAISVFGHTTKRLIASIMRFKRSDGARGQSDNRGRLGDDASF
jgi:hypothetical protein